MKIMSQEITNDLSIWKEYFELWEYEKALDFFWSFIQKDNSNPEILIYKWKILWALEKYSQALDCIKEALKIDPKNDEAKMLNDIFEDISENSKTDFESFGGLPESETEIQNEFEMQDVSTPRAPAPSPAPAQASQLQAPATETSSSISSPQSHEETRKESVWWSITVESKKAPLVENDIESIIQYYNCNKFDIKKFEKLSGTNELFFEFLEKVKLRFEILEHLADSNILPPRKYNTIISQINNTDAEFWIPYLSFNIWESKFNEILKKLWKPIKEIKYTDLSSTKKVIETISEKVSLLKVATKFFVKLFSFEKSFQDEKHKLQYFKYLFIFLWFIAVLVFAFSTLKNISINADIKSTKNMSWEGYLREVNIWADSVKN